MNQGRYEYAHPETRPIGTDPKLIKPYLRRNMERPRLHGKNNLCSTIRDIYVRSTDEDVRLWCRIAMRMSKHMYVALQEYKRMLQDLGVDVKATREDWQLRGNPGRIIYANAGSTDKAKVQN